MLEEVIGTGVDACGQPLDYIRTQAVETTLVDIQLELERPLSGSPDEILAELAMRLLGTTAVQLALAKANEVK